MPHQIHQLVVGLTIHESTGSLRLFLGELLMNKQNAQRHGSQFFAAFMLTILAGTLSAAVAPAGSFIGNQGSSTFTDSEG
ncbi:MAG: hypothetical protein ACI9HX_001064, partial [Pseudoalteromonas tetraodonis]